MSRHDVELPSQVYEQLHDKVAIIFQHEVLVSDCDWTPLDDISISVAYLGPKSVTTPIRFSTYGASVTSEGKLLLGGAQNLRCKKNLALGRRTCPACWERGDKEQVWERGPKVGTCKKCCAKADYLQTAFDPYFYYYRGTPDDKSTKHVEYNSSEHRLSQELKAGLLYAPVTPLVLPSIIDPDATEPDVFFDTEGLYQVRVFSRSSYGLRNVTEHGTIFDFSI